MELVSVPSRRRHLLDGAYAILLYGLAILVGYAVLAPNRLRLPSAVAVISPQKPLVTAVSPATNEPAKHSEPTTGTTDTPSSREAAWPLSRRRRRPRHPEFCCPRPRPRRPKLPPSCPGSRPPRPSRRRRVI